MTTPGFARRVAVAIGAALVLSLAAAPPVQAAAPGPGTLPAAPALPMAPVATSLDLKVTWTGALLVEGGLSAAGTSRLGGSRIEIYFDGVKVDAAGEIVALFFQCVAAHADLGVQLLQRRLPRALAQFHQLDLLGKVILRLREV